MSDLGAVIVAIPENTGLPIEVEGGPHVTLAYLGEDLLPNNVYKEAIDICRLAAIEYKGSGTSLVEELSYFGEDGDAEVLELDSEETSAAVDLRNLIVSKFSSELRYYLTSNMTYATYRPHMTLGYFSEGYELPMDVEVPRAIKFSHIALWNGKAKHEFALTTNELLHYGTPRKSGRYPWGSGEQPYQNSQSFLSAEAELRSSGMSEAEIAKALGFKSTTELRALKAIANNERKAAEITRARYLREEKQMSNVAIGDAMGRNESYIRTLLKDSASDKIDVLNATSDYLRKQVDEKKMVDVGAGTELHIPIGLSDTKYKTALAMLEAEGYEIINVQIEQLGTGKKTFTKVLALPGTKYKDIVADTSQIKSISGYTEDGGRTFLGIEPPVHISSDRIKVRYAEDGGETMDGVIQLRRGVDDISLGKSRYAQVRIGVDGTHYLKGMAVYSDDMPPGIDIIFNTNKSDKGDIHKAMKSIKDDPDNPFGSIIRQKHYIDANGKRRLSALNIVGSEDPDGVKRPGEEGAWALWSKKLSSQMLSKQSHHLAKEQLGLSYSLKKEELDEIMSLTNPAVKKKLLESFADDADSSAVKLKAAGLPRTANHVILPVNSLSDKEIYAPNYNNGEKVVLIRHPHGGTFEIPELTVNNKNREAERYIRNAVDAVGINYKVAHQLSGADFDGDTVLVIPNNSGKVKTRSPLSGLKDFDPQRAYPAYDGMKTIDGGVWNAKKGAAIFKEGQKPKTVNRQTEMGKVSNLITDMTLRGATDSEIARAVRHSMVVIDSEKHSLNFKQSEKDHNIRQLKAKYQGGPNKGASTIISRANSQERIPRRKLRRAKDGGPIDPKTGEKVYNSTPETYVNKKGKTITLKDKTTKMAATRDARTLISDNGGVLIEHVYADHANRLKALANKARKESYLTTPRPISKTAKKTYATEVDSLLAKLNTARKNKPRERQAQVVANTVVKQKLYDNPNMDNDTLKKVKAQALNEARTRTGAKKQNIPITPREWEAIQAGAISNNRLKSILDNTDLDLVKQYATPRTKSGITPAKAARARSMAKNGYTQADIAAALGVSASLVSEAIGEKE